jgi:hypothetical protein
VVLAAAYAGDPRRSPMRIKRAWIGEDEPVNVTAELQDGSELLLFSYYSDELCFTPSDLVGLTVDEARTLHHRRDVRYLQS